MISRIIKKKDIEIPSNLKEVRPAADRCLTFFKDLKLTKGDLFDLRLCLEESLINAIKYGNSLHRRIPVKVKIAYNDHEIFMAVEDQGPGFNPNGLKDPTQETNLDALKGRGIYLIKKLMDRVKYNSKGNRVEMIKVYKKNARVQ